MNENSQNPTNLNQTDLLEFALRLATYPGDPSTQDAKLLPGQLPDQLPVAIPFPEGSRILGSLIRNPQSITMFLDIHLSPEQVLAFYRQHMQIAGWQTTDIYRPDRGGFLSSGSRSRGGNEIFYQGLQDPALAINALESSPIWDDDNSYRSGPSLTVNAFIGKDKGTDLRLNLEMNSSFPLGPARHRRGHFSRNISSRLPAVEAPEGANQIGGGGGGSLDGANADATLETNKDLSTLAAHYKTQLQQAGCILSEEGQSGPLAWNTWTLKEDDDEQWHGFFMILKVLDHECYLTMRIRSDDSSKATTES